MLIIRLQRVGKKGQAYFRVVVTEHTKKPQGEALAILGSYDPHLKKLTVEKAKVEVWLGKGAQISPTVNNLMVNYKIWDRPKMQSWKVKKSDKSKEATAQAKSEPDSKPQAEPAVETKEEAQPESPATE